MAVRRGPSERRPKSLNWENKEVRQAGFEPATRCLEGSVEASRRVAWNRWVIR
jgi:hypothetical protein